jgi:hypothetical protein
MPIPEKKDNENKTTYISRCMSNETMKKDYPDSKQRVAVCLSKTKAEDCSLAEIVHDNLLATNCTWDDEWDEFVWEIEADQILEEDEQTIAAEHQGRKVTLNKPFRTPDGPKKFAVYVKNDNGKVVIVRFGDPNMKIKKNIPERRKSFRARHKCDQQKDKTTPAYWSCKMW